MPVVDRGSVQVLYLACGMEQRVELLAAAKPHAVISVLVFCTVSCSKRFQMTLEGINRFPKFLYNCSQGRTSLKLGIYKSFSMVLPMTTQL